MLTIDNTTRAKMNFKGGVFFEFFGVKKQWIWFYLICCDGLLELKEIIPIKWSVCLRYTTGKKLSKIFHGDAFLLRIYVIDNFRNDNRLIFLTCFAQEFLLDLFTFVGLFCRRNKQNKRRIFNLFNPPFANEFDAFVSLSLSIK